MAKKLGKTQGVAVFQGGDNFLFMEQFFVQDSIPNSHLNVREFHFMNTNFILRLGLSLRMIQTSRICSDENPENFHTNY